MEEKKEVLKNEDNIKKFENKPKRKRNQRRNKIEKAFSIFHWVLSFMLLISAILKAVLPYSQLKHVVLSWIIFSLLEIFLISMFINTIIVSKNIKKRLLSLFCFVVNAIIFAIGIFAGYDIALFIAFIYNSLLACVLLISFYLYKTKYPKGRLFDKKLTNVILIVFMIAIINIFNHTYVVEYSIMLYGLIPMAVILVIFAVLSFTIFKNTYKTLAKKVWVRVGVVLAVLVISFCYGMTFIDVVNASIKTQPQTIECVIVDKEVDSGSRQMLRCKLYVLIDNEKVAIEVPSDLYRIKEINDTLIVKFYQGSLNMAYYESGE